MESGDGFNTSMKCRGGWGRKGERERMVGATVGSRERAVGYGLSCMAASGAAFQAAAP